jgi:transglutaminase-like putative cysteine protease
MNRARLPVRAQGERAGRSGPFIASIAPETGPVGSLVVIAGLDFGANREDGSVRFAWSPEGGTGPRDDQSDPANVSPAEPELGYELWSDKEIRVRVPDGASSGALSVSGPAGSSNGVFFRVAAAPGIKRFKDRRSYSLSQGVSITKVKASGPNELYLWAPRPAESASQRVSKVLGQEPPPLVPDYRGTALFRFKDLASSRDLAMTQSYLVQVWAVETQVEADRVQARPEGAPPAMGAWLAADERVPASAPEVVAAAKRAAGGERNPWRATRQVWDWMTRNIAWTSSHEHARPQDALADKSADSWSYALLSCAILRAAGVPALPVAGYLVDPSRKAVRHYWVEVYLYGLGWVPLDPILGTGASPGGVQVAWEDRSRYLGSMDNRHLAFSRGTSLLAPMAPGGRRAAKDRRWSFQSFYEEASGGLEAYSSFWGDVEVTGMY